MSAPESSRSRLAGLDGIRGLAALYVVVNHTYLRSFPGYPRTTAPFWAGWLIYGRFAVVVFITLSGFALAVAPARNGWQLGGVGRFAHRRIWRIFPPYWAALTLSLLVAWLIVPQPGQAVPTAKSVVANGLLLQDLIDAPSPNRAFWTIAIEAQLYLVFPLLLLLIRRVNAVVMLATVTAVVVTVLLLAPSVPLLNAVSVRLEIDFAALFATGIMAAGIVSAGRRLRSWPWHWLALGTALPVLAAIAWQGSVWTITNFFWIDLALGPAIGCLLAALATNMGARQARTENVGAREARTPLLVRVLDSRPLRGLGSFSYSLYLTHAPIVVLVNEFIVSGRIRQGVPSFLVSLAIVIPAAIVFARLFAAVFELPFLRHRSWPALRGALANRFRRAEPSTSDA